MGVPGCANLLIFTIVLLLVDFTNLQFADKVYDDDSYEYPGYEYPDLRSMYSFFFMLVQIILLPDLRSSVGY